MAGKKSPITPQQKTALVQAALKARGNAYAPYSKYKVGAAVLGASGKIYDGCNVENASFGLTCCAERISIFKAISSGEKSLIAICVAGKSPKPCGACRQVMAEFMSPTAPVYIAEAGKKATVRAFTLDELLPFTFTSSEAGL